MRAMSNEVRQLEDGTFLCKLDNTVFSNARYAERHARFLTKGVSQGADDQMTTMEEAASENEAAEGGENEFPNLYTRARCLILDMKVADEYTRLALASRRDTPSLQLPPLPPFPSEDSKVKAIKSRKVGDEMLALINSEPNTATDRLLKELIQRSKVRRKRFLQKRRSFLSRYDERLSALLGNLYKRTQQSNGQPRFYSNV
eukprot:CAMPEP_0198731860 /NCGR_PEP_ID=MMETSP1475-20131203/32544_1 /TAXON_ID= ORGANISM="Unidentified sp., Strain CCMP1999" /NCGR_SAMPLE_ID=MMETSP1475 /ASSEMBLY_ACC=CAM_ASM_001111 /LENGTH=200 /DNA_ID=CAMNT_0044494875 /DNA_START=97 /DNA_END=699 /DNA_ORIENTATION=-